MSKNNVYKTFSFPYLGEEVNHYKSTLFTTDAKARYEKKKIIFRVEYQINNDEINKMILNNDLLVAGEIISTKLGFVKTVYFDSKATQLDIVLNSQDVDGPVDIKCYLISRRDIKYDNSDLVEEWRGLNPTILKNNVIGESNKKVITIKHDKKAQSIFSFQVKETMDEDDPPILDYSTDRLIFMMPKLLSREFSKIRSKSEFTIIETLIVPAMAMLLSKMGEENHEFYDSYCDKDWFKVILEKYEEIYPDRLIDSDPVDPYVAAQGLFPNMINATFDFVSKAGVK